MRNLAVAVVVMVMVMVVAACGYDTDTDTDTSPVVNGEYGKGFGEACSADIRLCAGGAGKCKDQVCRRQCYATTWPRCPVGELAQVDHDPVIVDGEQHGTVQSCYCLPE